MATPPLLMTERQALVAMAQILQGIDTDAGDVDISTLLASVLAVLAAGLVVGGQATFREQTLAPMTLTPQGQIRVQTATEAPDLWAPVVTSAAWDGNPWQGVIDG